MPPGGVSGTNGITAGEQYVALVYFVQLRIAARPCREIAQPRGVGPDPPRHRPGGHDGAAGPRAGLRPGETAAAPPQAPGARHRRARPGTVLPTAWSRPTRLPRQCGKKASRTAGRMTHRGGGPTKQPGHGCFANDRPPVYDDRPRLGPDLPASWELPDRRTLEGLVQAARRRSARPSNTDQWRRPPGAELGRCHVTWSCTGLAR